MTKSGQVEAQRPPLEADDTPIGRDWVEYAYVLEAELATVRAERDALQNLLRRVDHSLVPDAPVLKDIAQALAAPPEDEPEKEKRPQALG